MSIYCEHFFPWLMEKIGDYPKEVIGQLRKDTLKGVSGKVLDIGFGIGFNMLYYPSSVKSVSALEPSENMNKRAARFNAESSAMGYLWCFHAQLKAFFSPSDGVNFTVFDSGI